MELFHCNCFLVEDGPGRIAGLFTCLVTTASSEKTPAGVTAHYQVVPGNTGKVYRR
jgi:hypothetical protein